MEFGEIDVSREFIHQLVCDEFIFIFYLIRFIMLQFDIKYNLSCFFILNIFVKTRTKINPFNEKIISLISRQIISSNIYKFKYFPEDIRISSQLINLDSNHDLINPIKYFRYHSLTLFN